MGDERTVGEGPYRSARLDERRPPRARRPEALALAWLLLGAAGVAVSAARRAGPHAAETAGDARVFGAPVLHASLLAGGASVCALTRLRGGRHQVVCSRARVVTAHGEAREVPHAWLADDLARLLPTTDDRSPRGEAEVLATGELRDGRWVQFRAGEDAARPVALPPGGGHGRVVELRFAAGTEPGPSEFEPVLAWSAWVARTADGGLWVTDARRPSSWATVLRPGDDVRAVAIDGTGYCALSGEREVLCGELPRTSWGVEEHRPDVAGPTLVAALEQPGQEEVALRDGLACARSRSGAVRCARPGGAYGQPAPVPLRGFAGRAVAMALGRDDLCLADAAGAWWCARGPDEDDPEPVARGESLTLRRVPSLAVAREVAFAGGTGCARRASGEVRCWGRAVRGGFVLSRERATEIEGARGATALAADDDVACAIVAGRVRCWGARVPLGAGHGPSARPVEVPIPEPVQALAAGRWQTCAAGRDVWCWSRGPGAPEPLALARAGVAGAVRSLAVAASEVCALTDRGEAWCWRGRYWSRPSRAPELEGGDALVVYRSTPCASRDGRVIACSTGDQWRLDVSWYADHDEALRRRVPAGLGAVVATTHDPMVWACALGATGRVACRGSTEDFAVVPGVEGARVVAGYAGFGCALTADARVLCWGANVGGALTAAEVDRAPRLVPFTR